MRSALLLWVLIPLIALTVLSTIVASHFAQGFASDFFDSFLLNSADSIAARVHAGKEGIAVANLPAESQALFGHNGEDRFFYRVVDSEGRSLAGNTSIDLPMPTQAMWHKFGSKKVADRVVRFCTVPTLTAAGTVIVQVGETVNSRSRLLHKVMMSILLPQIILICLACLSVWFGVGKGLQPLHQLQVVLRSRDKPNFSPVAIDHVPSELLPVLGALNDLFAGLGHQFRLQHEFIADAAHQLRTPVTAVKIYTDHMVRLGQNGPSHSALLGLEEASNRLTTMVNKLLLLARMEAKTTIETSEADLNQAVVVATNTVIQQAQGRHIEMIFDLPKVAVKVQADPDDVTELISNLLDNAIKYTPNNGSVWVFVREQQGAIVSLIVEDSGPGIPDEHKENIFKRFFRLPGATGAGCGLGMAIAKEITSSCNATISVSDRAGGGASFHIAFRKISRAV